MTPTYTLTLKNQAGTVTAVIRYPEASTAYPDMIKSFTEHVLIDGTRAFDEPTDAIKREWNLTIQYENVSDALLTNLKLLFETRATLLLDEDALIVESNIPVYFKTFKPIYQFGQIFHYQIGLQEI